MVRVSSHQRSSAAAPGSSIDVRWMFFFRTMTAGARLGRRARMSILCIQLLSGTVYVEPAAAAAAEDSGDAVKAAYLYRFAGYVEWPRTRDSSNTFVIAVIKSPGVARELKRLAAEHQVNNRPVYVIEARRIRDAGRPAMLFIGSGHANILLPASGDLAANSTLIVTDEEGGLDAGAALNFLALDHRVRFEVSLTAADRAHLKISAELLAVAVRVLGGGRQSRDRRGAPLECDVRGHCNENSRPDPS